jgi:hypothetical protein
VVSFAPICGLLSTTTNNTSQHHLGFHLLSGTTTNKSSQLVGGFLDFHLPTTTNLLCSFSYLIFFHFDLTFNY